MPGAVDVGVVPVSRCVLLVGGSYCDTALLLLRSVVYLVEGNLAVGRVIRDLLCKYLGYCRSKGGLAVVYVADGADVEVRLVPLKYSS